MPGPGQAWSRLTPAAGKRREVVTMASRPFVLAGPGPRDRRRRPGWWVALITAAALTAAGCGGTSPPRSASPSSLPKTTLTACTVNGLAARCGYVWVPQDWAHPDGPVMSLQVVVVPAATSHPAAPLFYLAGYNGDNAGFGDAVLNGMTWAVQAFTQLNQTMDLVFVEQRGTSGSGLETCPALQSASTTVDPAAISAAARRCLASASRDPRHDTTSSAVRDLDQVRQALGYDKINIYGPSYGVTIGLAYLQRYSSHVRAAVLDSGSLLSVPLWQQGAVHDQQAFDQLAAQCAATPACARSYHPAADLAAILARLNAHPAQVTLSGPGGRHQTVPVTSVVFLSLVTDLLSDTQTMVQLPAVLHALALGQWSQVIARLGFTTAALSGGPTALQAITIECSDAWAAMNPATVSQQGPSVFIPMVTGQAERLHALCSVWPHDPGVSGTVRSTVPVVFLNGTLDTTDPPANVVGATATMPNALLVSVPGTGHFTLGTATNPGCLIAATTAFIQAGQPPSPAPWQACTRALAQELVPFPAP
jgi:pimeloyl-ACP methyl ester carboxylesterase